MNRGDKTLFSPQEVSEFLWKDLTFYTFFGNSLHSCRPTVLIEPSLAGLLTQSMCLTMNTIAVAVKQSCS